jgi:plasmid stabilization system protein ParE
MKVVFLPSSDEDVRWFTRYYRVTFPEGRRNARAQMARALTTLANNPRIGHLFEETELREYVIPRTPFSLIYRIAGQHIEILRLWDGRANRDRLNSLHEKLR